MAVLIATGTLASPAFWTLGILAAIFLVTALVGLCPLYALPGLSTRARKTA